MKNAGMRWARTGWTFAQSRIVRRGIPSAEPDATGRRVYGARRAVGGIGRSRVEPEGGTGTPMSDA